jgi:acyl carrier protein
MESTSAVMKDFASRARDLLADALELDPGEIGEEASVDTVGAWTSLGHMRLVLALEQELGRELDPESIVGISTLKDVESLLQSDV